MQSMRKCFLKPTRSVKSEAFLVVIHLLIARTPPPPVHKVVIQPGLVQPVGRVRLLHVIIVAREESRVSVLVVEGNGL